MVLFCHFLFFQLRQHFFCAQVFLFILDFLRYNLVETKESLNFFFFFIKFSIVLDDLRFVSDLLQFLPDVLVIAFSKGIINNQAE